MIRLYMFTTLISNSLFIHYMLIMSYVHSHVHMFWMYISVCIGNDMIHMTYEDSCISIICIERCLVVLSCLFLSYLYLHLYRWLSYIHLSLSSCLICLLYSYLTYCSYSYVICYCYHFFLSFCVMMHTITCMPLLWRWSCDSPSIRSKSPEPCHTYTHSWRTTLLRYANLTESF